VPAKAPFAVTEQTPPDRWQVDDEKVTEPKFKLT
jgi:hypothetical protein